MFERTFDVVVVGGGPAGLAAAVRAAEAGRSVAVVDDNPALGGQIWRADRGRQAPSARRWIERMDAAGVEILAGTTILGVAGPRRSSSCPPDVRGRSATQPEGRAAFCAPPAGRQVGSNASMMLLAESNGSPLRLHTSRVILATGARERFLPFPGWTLPGVYGVGGLQALVKGGWEVSGQRLLLAGSGPLLLAVASSLRQRGAEIVGIVEQAPFSRLLGFGAGLISRPAKLLQLARLEASLRGVPRHYGTWPVRVVGDGQVQSVVLSREQTIRCDGLACGFGLIPDTRLAALLGCRLESNSGERVVVDPYQATSVPGVFCAGESTGIGGVDLAQIEGQIAGLAAAGQPGQAAKLFAQRRREQRFANALERAFALRDELRSLPDDDTVICRCEDATWSQIQNAVDARDAKLRSRCGMGPCQGRVCGPALEFLHGFKPSAPRPPLFPVPLGIWAELSAPVCPPSP